MHSDCTDINTKLNSFVLFCLLLFFFVLQKRVILMPRIIKLYSNVYLMCVYLQTYLKTCKIKMYTKTRIIERLNTQTLYVIGSAFKRDNPIKYCYHNQNFNIIRFTTDIKISPDFSLSFSHLMVMSWIYIFNVFIFRY